MRCEDIERELANVSAETALSESARIHLAGCPGCQRARDEYAQVALALEALPAWQPPTGFARTLARQAINLAATETVRPETNRGPAAGFPWPMVVDTIGLAAAAGAAGYFVMRLPVPLQPALNTLVATPELSWLWVAGAFLLGFRVWRSRA